MKINLSLTPPDQLGFPEYIGWLYSVILMPYPLYIITTVDEQGIPNAQPNTWGLPFGDGYAQFFLFYDWACHHTIQNVIATGEFVVNIPSEDVVPQVMQTVKPYPRGIDEIAASGLTALPATVVRAPRVQECRAHLECRVRWHKQSHPRGKDDAGVVVLGEIVAASADREVLAGTAGQKMAGMRPVFVLSRSVDLGRMSITDQLTYGTVDRLKDFLKLEKEGIVEVV